MILVRLPVVFEPVDQHLERNVVRLVVVEALRAHTDELLEHFFFWNIAEDDVLGVDWENSESVGDAARLFFLLFLEASFQILEGLCIREFLMTHNFTH